MPRKVSGQKKKKIIQPESQIEVDRFGIARITILEKVYFEYLQDKGNVRPLGQKHPVFPLMEITRATGTMGVDGFWGISYVYEGVLGAMPEPTYELNGSLEAQPIQTHPDFETFAGTPSAPLNGAIFDEQEAFVEFGISGGKKAGIQSFMDPSATWTKVSFSVIKPMLRDLGKIEAPPGQPPKMSSRNWLFWGVSSRKRGGVWELRETWKMSGRGGWDEDVYQ